MNLVSLFMFLLSLFIIYIPIQIFINENGINIKKINIKTSLFFFSMFLFFILLNALNYFLNPIYIYLNDFITLIFSTLSLGIVKGKYSQFFLMLIIFSFAFVSLFLFLKGRKTKNSLKNDFLKNKEMIKKKKEKYALEDQKIKEYALQNKNKESNSEVEIKKVENIQNNNFLNWSFIDLIEKPNWKKGIYLKTLNNKLKDYQIAFFHDKNIHFLMFKIPSGEFKYENNRSENENQTNADRKKLKSFLIPIDDMNKPLMANKNFDNSQNNKNGFDRTHLFPVSLIGTEIDERLLVLFDRNLNKGILNEFEIKAKKYIKKNGGVWITILRPTSSGQVVFSYRLYDYNMTKRIAKLDVKSNHRYLFRSRTAK